MTSDPVETADYNTRIIEEFRANQGRLGGPWAGYTVILIHHIGARSMIERVTPLSCFPQRDGRWAIVASDGGAPSHPDWYHNLKANPKIRVELGAERSWSLRRNNSALLATRSGRSWSPRFPALPNFRAASRDGFRCSS